MVGTGGRDVDVFAPGRAPAQPELVVVPLEGPDLDDREIARDDTLDDTGTDTPAIVGDVVVLPNTDFGDFYAKEWPRALRLAALLTQQSSAAEDLAQEAFARVLGAWHRAERPAAYLTTTIVNTCREWGRRQGRERDRLPLLLSPQETPPAFGELADALSALPYRQRAVLVLRYYEDLTEAQIAETLGCRIGTVKSLASRGLAQLKKVIEP